MSRGGLPGPRRLMAVPIAVLALLAGTGAVVGDDDPPGWLGWCPPWVLAVAGALLGVVGVWLVEPWATRRREQADRERAGRDALADYLGRARRLPLVEEMDPLRLGVHRSGPLPNTVVHRFRPAAGLDPDLVTWVQRDRAADVCRWLDTAAVTGGMLVLVGDSSTGKTRLLHEVVRERLTGWSVLQPDPGDGALINKVAAATFPLPRLVVWLDKLDWFLPGPGQAEGDTSVTATAIRQLLDAPTPVVILGTLWARDPDDPHGPTTEAGATTRRPPRLTAAGLLEDPRCHWVKLDSFNKGERAAARRLAGRDPRLAAVVDDRRYGITEALAGAPELVDRYHLAGPTGRAILHAAADSIRLGVRSPLTDELLSAAARPYLNHFEPDDAWYGGVRDRLAERGLVTAPLEPVLSADRRRRHGWTVADYLQQHLTRARASDVPPAAVWDAWAKHVTDPTDRQRLIDSAECRALGRITRQLSGDEAPADGQWEWWWCLRVTPPARTDAVTDNDEKDRTSYRGLVHSAEVAIQAGRIEEAEQVWRDAVAAGHRYAGTGLATHLRLVGKLEEAEQALKDAVAAGNPLAGGRLAELMEELGRGEDAERAWLDAIAAGDKMARSKLARFYEQEGRLEDADAVRRDAVAVGDPYAHNELARDLEWKGRADDAEQVDWDRLAAGDSTVGPILERLLEEAGLGQEATRLKMGCLEPEDFTTHLRG